MTAANPEKRAQPASQDDYGQALAEGEITHFENSTGTKFTKSETLAAEDIEFKPRSLVEIAFAAERNARRLKKSLASNRHNSNQSRLMTQVLLRRR